MEYPGHAGNYFPEIVMDSSDSAFVVRIGTRMPGPSGDISGGSGSLSIIKNDSYALFGGNCVTAGEPANAKFGVLKDNLRLISRSNIQDGVSATGPRASVYFSAENQGQTLL